MAARALQLFYDGLAAAQRHVVNEISLEQLSERLNQNDSVTTAAQIHGLLATLKSYYMTQLLLCKAPTGSKQSYPWQRDDSPLYNSFQRCSVVGSLPEITVEDEDFAKFCNGLTRDLDKDIVTFSVLPSYFRFFLLESSVERFLAFLQGQKANRLSFARVLFHTPPFVNFVNAVAYPLLQQFLGSRLPSTFLGDLLERWREHARLCPGYVSRFLVEGDSISALRDCFFLPFFADPARWLAVEAFQDIPPGFFDDVLAKLPPKVGMFVDALTVGATDPTPFVTRVSQAVDPESWRDVVVDGFARAVFAAIPDGRPSFDCDKYAVFLTRVADLDRVMGVQAELAANHVPTQVGENVAAYWLRQLVKAAPPLPEGEIVVEGLDYHDLVDRADLIHRPKQRFIYSQFEEVVQRSPRLVPTHPNFYGRWFRDFFLTHDEQIQIMAARSKLGREITRWKRKSSDALDRIPLLLSLRKLQEFTGAHQQPFAGLAVYEEPGQFHERLRLRLGEFKQHTERRMGGKCDPRLHFHVLARNINFRAFRRANPHLRILDEAFVLAANRQSAALEQAPQADEHHRAAINDILKFSDCANRLRAAYDENTNPLIKAERISKAFHDIYEFYIDEFDPAAKAQQQLPGDQYPIFIAVLSKFPPSSFASGNAFVQDFVFGRESGDPFGLRLQALSFSNEGGGFEVQRRIFEQQGELAAHWHLTRIANIPGRLAVVGGQRARDFITAKSGATQQHCKIPFETRGGQALFDLDTRFFASEVKPDGKFDAILYFFEGSEVPAVFGETAGTVRKCLEGANLRILVCPEALTQRIIQGDSHEPGTKPIVTFALESETLFDDISTCIPEELRVGTRFT
jgi:hypothetical protein